MHDAAGQGSEIPDLGRLLSDFPCFRKLQPHELAGILPQVEIIRLEAGASLFTADTAGDSAYFVVLARGEGLARLRLTGPAETGRPILLAAGDAFCEIPLRDLAPSIAILAEEPSTLLRVPLSALDPLAAGSSVKEELVRASARHVLRLQLASVPMLRDLSEDLFARLVANAEFVTAQRGDVVMREGEEPDCLYFVTSGSLEVFRQHPDGSATTIDILREGAFVGELALLLKDHRTASVRAWRDALLIRISGQSFEDVFRQDALLTLRLARTLAERLKHTTISPQHRANVKAIAIVFWRHGQDAKDFRRRLEEALEAANLRAAVLDRADFIRETGDQGVHPDRIAAWLAREEANHDYLFCECDPEGREWTRAAIRQADMVLFVCPSGERPVDRTWPEIELTGDTRARLELLMIRPSSSEPRHTLDWLALAPFAEHQHLVSDNREDYARLVRRLTGKAWGLVLSGGGARGLAHIGVIRALRENGQPIDMIAGTSMGAIIAGQYALGRSPAEILEATRKVYASGSRAGDLTVPFVSLRTGEATIRALRALFGDSRIEDLPIGYFCVSCNLTRAEPVYHDRGPVWMWNRTSCSIPGLLPPVPYQGDLLVDGAFLDNLPVEAMRKRMGGRVAASDVSVAVDLTVDRVFDSVWSWSGFAQLSKRFRKQPRLPNIVQMLMRTTELSSIRDARGGSNPADLYLKPPVDHFPMTAFGQIDRIVELGYEYTMRYLQSLKPEQGPED